MLLDEDKAGSTDRNHQKRHQAVSDMKMLDVAGRLEESRPYRSSYNCEGCGDQLVDQA